MTSKQYHDMLNSQWELEFDESEIAKGLSPHSPEYYWACKAYVLKAQDDHDKINDLRKDLKWAFGEMNLAFFQKGDEQQVMVEKYSDIIQELMSE